MISRRPNRESEKRRNGGSGKRGQGTNSQFGTPSLLPPLLLSLEIGSLLTPFARNEKNVNIRDFTEKQKREAYERQKGICPVCKNYFEIEGMDADHITPRHEGRKPRADNWHEDNRRKFGK